MLSSPNSQRNRQKLSVAATKDWALTWPSLCQSFGLPFFVLIAYLALIIVAVLTLSSVSKTEEERLNIALDERLIVESKAYATYIKSNLSIIDEQLIRLRAKLVAGKPLSSQQELLGDPNVLDGLLAQVATADATGNISYSSLGFASTPVSIADRAYFLAAKNQGVDKLYIGNDVVGPISKKHTLQLVRIVHGPDARFGGVIVGSVDLEKLKDNLSGMLQIDKGLSLTIQTPSGGVRFRNENNGLVTEATTEKLPLQEFPSQKVGLRTTISAETGIKQREAFFKLDGYDLSVLVEVSVAQQLVEFNQMWRNIWKVLLIFVSASALIPVAIFSLQKTRMRSRELQDERRNFAFEKDDIKLRFLLSVSHELRTPLNSVLGFSELIRDSSEHPQTVHYANLINQSGTRLYALVNTILDLSIIDCGKMAVEYDIVNLPEFLNALVSIHKVECELRGIELSLSVFTGSLTSVTIDRAKLCRVIDILITSAVKFTPDGAIFIVVKPVTETGFTISVTDSGVGVKSNLLPYVFDRISVPGEQEAIPGFDESRLDLSLCKELVTLLNGKISIFSELGQGTTVEISLPLLRPSDHVYRNGNTFTDASSNGTKE